MVRLLRRAIAKHGTVAIDLKVVSGRKHGWLTKEPEVGRGWTTGLGEKIPTYRFTYERVKGGGQGTFELPAAGVDDLMTLTKHKDALLITNVVDKLSEMKVEGEPPLWFNIIQNGLSAGRKFYFAGGGNRIWDLYTQRSAGKQTVVLRLEHVKRKKNGQPDRQTYTIWEQSFEDWTLTKYEDGHKLTMRQNVKKKVTEAADEPAVVSMFKKLLDGGQQIFFRDRSGKKTRLWRVTDGVSVSNKPMWWFHDTVTNKGTRPLTWRSIDTIDKLTLKKDGSDWILFDKTVKLKEEIGGEPLIITLMNKRIAKQGAVSAKLDILPAGKQLVGWITAPIEPVPAMGGKTQWRAVVQKASGGKGVFMFGDDADSTHTLTTKKDRKGNTSVEVTNREAG